MMTWDPMYRLHHMRSWKLRIRPDLATRVIPDFPRLSYEAWMERQEWLRNQPPVMV